MEIKVFCQNCQVEILRADTYTLKTPLVGSMFRVKKDMEWSLFSPHDTGLDLTCPMCDWTFHENGKVKVAVGDDFVFGVPEVIIPGILGFYEESGEITEEALSTVAMSSVVDKVMSLSTDPNLKTIRDQVEGDKEEEKAPVPPEIAQIQDAVEGVPDKKDEEVETPQTNEGAWSEFADSDEDSETDGIAPPGAVATEPQASKNKGGRPKGSKNKGRKYKK